MQRAEDREGEAGSGVSVSVEGVSVAGAWNLGVLEGPFKGAALPEGMGGVP